MNYRSNEHRNAYQRAYRSYRNGKISLDDLHKVSYKYRVLKKNCKFCGDRYETRYMNSEYCSHKCVKSAYSVKSEDGFVWVYYLPEEHYIGITKNVKKRMCQHRSSGKIVDGFELIAGYERHIDAHMLETMFHQRGYRGGVINGL